MKRFAALLAKYWRLLFPTRIVLLRAEKILTKPELVKALSADVAGVPTFEALVQLIDQLEEQCIEGAIGSVSDHGAVASETGGVQSLRELRRVMFQLRALGRKDEDDDA